jgi:hypothetical protein
VVQLEAAEAKKKRGLFFKYSLLKHIQIRVKRTIVCGEVTGFACGANRSTGLGVIIHGTGTRAITTGRLIGVAKEASRTWQTG